MRSEEGKKVVLDLVAQVDVVIENFKAGTLEKLGIGYDKMLEVNPGLIYGSISGFGTYGPLSHLPCMDIIAAARSGLVAQSGEAGSAPIKPGFSMCDTWAGLQLMRGLSMALQHKQKTGKGLRVDIAMLDCAFYMCEASVLEHSLTGEFTEKSGNHYVWYAPPTVNLRLRTAMWSLRSARKRNGRASAARWGWTPLPPTRGLPPMSCACKTAMR